jgi:hypothetical protein
MADETINRQNKPNEETDKISFSQFGFQSAGKAKSAPESIIDGLHIVYEYFFNDQKKNKDQKIEQLETEIELENKRKNENDAKLETSKQTKDLKDEELKELNIDRVKIKEGDGEVGDITTFIIGAFITLLLTMYLFVFYSSSGYSAFYGIKQGSLGFINPNVFSDAINKGGGVIALIILFPVIFLGLGFLIHDSLETNKKLKKAGKNESYTLISALLFITLIADVFIGYKISQGVHTNEFNAGLTDKIWEFKMIFSDINFYLVLVLGFVVYVIWGFLLNRVLSHTYLKTESEITKILLEEKDKEINTKREEINEIQAKISSLVSDIKNNELSIAKTENSLIRYKTGSIPVDADVLKSNVGEFWSGWESFTLGHWGSEAEKLNNASRKIKEDWLSNKIQNLNSDN